MNRIHALSQDLQNKIAAGEVIERPASVVKELLENALDAGAEHIEIQVEDGGKRLIKVVDDGSGIAFEDLPLSLAPHATSKLDRADDLYNIRTMGFRGEALASVAAVAQVTITSRTGEAPGGGRVTCEGGTIGEPAPCGCPAGTTVEVRNLFFNTPARRKFIKTAATEISHVTEQVARVALAHPGVAIKVMHNDKTIYDLPAVETLRERIGDFFGRELAESLIAIEREGGPVRLFALVSRPVEARSSPRWQYTWLNGRYIRDRFVQHAAREAYRGLMDPSRQPVLFLYLDADPANFDVNVHPTKIEVRWADSGIVHGLTLAALREALLACDNTAALRVDEAAQKGPPAGESFRRAQQRVREAIADFFREAAPAQRHLGFPRRSISDRFDRVGPPPAESRGTGQPPAGGIRPITDALQDVFAPLTPPVPLSTQAPVPRPAPATPEQVPAAGSMDRPMPEAPAAEPAREALVRAIQVHNTYLVAETPEGIVIVDQHALHERVLYEQFRARVTAGNLESQRLLLPETVSVPPEQTGLVTERAELLARLGIEATVFGPDAIAVQAFPSLAFGRVPIGPFMVELLGKLAAAPSDYSAEKMLDDMLNLMACKAAVKAGDPLSQPEINALLGRWQHVEASSNCPHGRPTVLRLTVADLARQFKRM